MRTLDLSDEEAHRDHALIFAGHDPGVCASCFNSLALLMVGHPDQALTGLIDHWRWRTSEPIRRPWPMP